MINIEKISKSFGGNVLFDEASLRVNSRERIGLVGRNGHGKTTLLSMITGKEEPDSGTVSIPRNYRIGYVRQHLSFTEETILAEGMKGLNANEKDHHWKVEKILAGLGFTQADMIRPPAVFSGGYQVRLNLAKVLISEPDLLLLDEPTNYLDIASIRWIRNFLNAWPHEILLITHDRSFMDSVVTHTAGVHRCKIRKIAGDTSVYYDQTAQEEEIYEKTRINDEKKKKEIELFITRFRAKARLANLVQSRVKTLSKMEKKEKLESMHNLEFSFRNLPFKGKQMLRVENLSFAYSKNKPLVRGLSFGLNHGDRICIIGRNGMGKTTLLKLLAGDLAPDSGSTQYNPSVTRGFFEQTNISSLVASRTVEDEILYCNNDVDRQLARNICGAMMFSGDNALKRVSVLSGGEKSRVMLGKLLVTPVNLLLLDEPTNHLDMDSCDAMLTAIDSFNGAVIMVTHNEMFLHALAERLIVFQGGETELYEGGYQHFLDNKGWLDEGGAAGEAVSGGCDDSISRKELRKLRSDIVTRRSRKLKPLEKQVAAAEKIIEASEKRLEELSRAMIAATGSQDGSRIGEIGKEIHACEAAIEKAFTAMEEITSLISEKSMIYEEELHRLESLGG